MLLGINLMWIHFLRHLLFWDGLLLPDEVSKSSILELFIQLSLNSHVATIANLDIVDLTPSAAVSGASLDLPPTTSTQSDE
jgi:hypothetical protein